MFEYKQRKLNRGVEALSANPVIGTESASSSDSAVDSDDPDESFPTLSLLERKMSPDGLSTNEPSLKESLRQVLVIHEKTETETSESTVKPATSQRRPKDAPGTSLRVLGQTKSILSESKRTLGPEAVTEKGKPSIPRSATFRPVKSKTLDAHGKPMATEAAPKRKERPPGSSCMASKTNPDKPYAPPANSNIPNLDESCIAKRLSRHRGQRNSMINLHTGMKLPRRVISPIAMKAAEAPTLRN